MVILEDLDAAPEFCNHENEHVHFNLENEHVHFGDGSVIGSSNLETISLFDDEQVHFNETAVISIDEDDEHVDFGDGSVVGSSNLEKGVVGSCNPETISLFEDEHVHFNETAIISIDEDDEHVDCNEIPVISIDEANNSVETGEGAEIDDEKLLGMKFNSLEDAYEFYNSYAKRHGFGVRKFRSRKKKDDIVYRKQFCCNKQGFKSKVGKERSYTKLETRVGCKAMIQLLFDGANWIVEQEEDQHNHELVPCNQARYFRSHRDMPSNDVAYLSQLKASGVGVTAGYRVLSDQARGVQNMPYTIIDARNHVAKLERRIWEGGDANGLLNILKERQAREDGFYFNYDLNKETASLCSIFWRDSRMRKDYEVFGDLVVFDTTHRTVKYNLACAPFTGMNHHKRNIMFGVGFLIHEDKDSFLWLLNEFLKSKGGKQPATIMTDEDAAMAAAIPLVLTQSRHRLCTWHIDENSKKHIQYLRIMPGFINLFHLVLRSTDTIPEFDFYWKK
ncbi:Protein FAR1-RELATED SEQUENCE 5 [Striga hermonthica]|uniref:Protein FAR1-RELATED SEQUENCE 5 n=1 Tax=Striga hermonthica TaxID=68872 RepID=A0A9N7MJU0_STRHE|nr:Protein FAR1-RELATED SEQUENCE 5 [Striga hermonthica]